MSRGREIWLIWAAAFRDRRVQVSIALILAVPVFFVFLHFYLKTLPLPR